MDKTFTYTLMLDAERATSPEALRLACARAIEYAMDNDLEGAEVLNRNTVGQVSIIGRT